MKTVYEASVYGSITPKQIVRETNSSVFIIGGRGKEERQAKETVSSKIFDDVKDAINYIIKHQEAKVESANKELERRKKDLLLSQSKSVNDWLNS